MSDLPKKELDNSTYISALIDIVNSGQEVPLPVSGNSMVPFLVDGRDIIVIGPKKKKLKKGDMALFKRDNGQYVMHRIYKVKKGGDCFFVGDNQTFIEGPVTGDFIFAIVVRVKRKGEWLKSGDFIWDFFSRVWISVVKIRPILYKTYRLFKRLKVNMFCKKR